MYGCHPQNYFKHPVHPVANIGVSVGCARVQNHSLQVTAKHIFLKHHIFKKNHICCSLCQKRFDFVVCLVYFIILEF